MTLSRKKVELKKQQIVATAIEIIKRKGYGKATMEEIAAELLMTKGSLYYYFKNKSDLMRHCHNFVLAKAIEDMKDILNRNLSIEATVEQMITCHMTYAIKEKETFNLIMEPKYFFEEEQLTYVLNLRKQYEELFDELISRGIRRGYFSPREPTIARLILLGAMNWVQIWYRPDGRLSIDEIIRHYIEYCWKILK